MLKLIIGKKGSGKTKTLISMVNDALNMTKGDVVCIEKGDKLKFDIRYQCRLIDAEEYLIDDGQSLFGFISGILASNHDVTDIFIDSALKICDNKVDTFERFVLAVKAFAEDKGLNVVMTVSSAPDALPEAVRALI